MKTLFQGLGIVAVAMLATAWAQDAPLPEGSASVIETRTWRLSAADPAGLRSQVKAAVVHMTGLVLVKEEDGLLVLSLPTVRLSELRERLSALGAAPDAAETPAPRAPTTLLRLRFHTPPATS